MECTPYNYWVRERSLRHYIWGVLYMSPDGHKQSPRCMALMYSWRQGKTCASVKTRNVARRKRHQLFTVNDVAEHKIEKQLKNKIGENNYANYWWFAKFVKVFYHQNFLSCGILGRFFIHKFNISCNFDTGWFSCHISMVFFLIPSKPQKGTPNP